MRREDLYLADIIEAADSIEQFIKDAEKDAFLADDLLRSGVLHKLTIIGEAASHLPSEFRNRHLGIEWADIIGFRNIAVHSYFSVDWNIVWATATVDVPDLRARIAAIVDSADPPGLASSNAT